MQLRKIAIVARRRIAPVFPPTDGQLGGKTRNAIRQFQAQSGLVPDGFASSQVLDRLRGR